MNPGTQGGLRRITGLYVEGKQISPWTLYYRPDYDLALVNRLLRSKRLPRFYEFREEYFPHPYRSAGLTLFFEKETRLDFRQGMLTQHRFLATRIPLLKTYTRPR